MSNINSITRALSAGFMVMAIPAAAVAVGPESHGQRQSILAVKTVTTIPFKAPRNAIPCHASDLHIVQTADTEDQKKEQLQTFAKSEMAITLPGVIDILFTPSIALKHTDPGAALQMQTKGTYLKALTCGAPGPYYFSAGGPRDQSRKEQIRHHIQWLKPYIAMADNIERFERNYLKGGASQQQTLNWVTSGMDPDKHPPPHKESKNIARFLLQKYGLDTNAETVFALAVFLNNEYMDPDLQLLPQKMRGMAFIIDYRDFDN